MEESRKMKLSPRLQVCADYILPGASVVDVGTDHAYLPIWLIQSGKVRLPVTACDISSGPLERARGSAAEYGAEDDIVFAHCDGLTGIEADGTDTVVIAGMGGETILNIILTSKWNWLGRSLILQPMSRLYELCRGLYENGFYIESSKLVRDAGEIYHVLLVKSGEAAMPEPLALYAGLACRHDPLYGEIIEKLVKKFSRMEKGLAASERMGPEFLREARMLHEAALNEKKELEKYADCKGNI